MGAVCRGDRPGGRRGQHCLLLRAERRHSPAGGQPVASVAPAPGGRGHCSALPDLRHGEGPGHQLRPGGCAGEPAPAPAHGAPHLRRHGAHPPAGRLLRPGGGHPPDRRLPLLQDRTVDAPGRQGQPYHHHVRHVRRLLRPLRHAADRRHVRHGGDQCGRALLRRHRALRPLRHYRPVGGPALRRAAHRLLPPGGAQPYPRHPSPVHRHGGPLRPAFHPVLPDDARRPPAVRQVPPQPRGAGRCGRGCGTRVPTTTTGLARRWSTPPSEGRPGPRPSC